MIKVSKSVYGEGFAIIKDGTENEANVSAAFNAMQQLASPSDLIQP